MYADWLRCFCCCYCCCCFSVKSVPVYTCVFSSDDDEGVIQLLSKGLTAISMTIFQQGCTCRSAVGVYLGTELNLVVCYNIQATKTLKLRVDKNSFATHFNVLLAMPDCSHVYLFTLMHEVNRKKRNGK